MATLYADGSGNLLRVILDAADAARFPGVPTGNVTTLDFDPTTNPTLATAARTAAQTVNLTSGPTITISGSAYALIAASQDYTTIQLVRQAITALKGSETLPSLATIQAAILAVQNGTATNAQAQLALAVVMRLLGLLAQRLVNNGTLFQ